MKSAIMDANVNDLKGNLMDGRVLYWLQDQWVNSVMTAKKLNKKSSLDLHIFMAPNEGNKYNSLKIWPYLDHFSLWTITFKK